METKGLSKEYYRFRLWFNIIFYFTLLFFAPVLVLIIGLILTVNNINIGITYFINVGIIFCVVFLLFITIIYLYKLWLSRYVKSYYWAITDDYINTKEGVFTSVENRIPYSRIQNVGIIQGFWEKRFKWYRVMIQTAGDPIASTGTSNAEGCLVGIRDPYTIQNMILEKSQKYLVMPSSDLDSSVASALKSDNLAAKETDNKLDQIVSLLKEISKKLD